METRALSGIDIDIPAGQFVTRDRLQRRRQVDAAQRADRRCRGQRPGASTSTGTDVTGWPPPRRAGLVARVFQDPHGRQLRRSDHRGEPGARRRAAAVGAASACAVDRRRRDDFRARLRRLGLGLENRLGDRMGLLSGGQRQAVSLLMATLRPMKILLLDEHTAALDPKTAEFVLDLTRRIVAEQKLTTLMVTHSMRQALDYGERTVMLHEGRVVFDVAGAERRGLDVPDLLALFARQRGHQLADDSLLLA